MINISTNKIESFFIKAFKIVLLLSMSISFIFMLVFLVLTLYEYSKTPSSPLPAKTHELKQVTTTDFKKIILDKKKPKNSTETENEIDHKHYPSKYLSYAVDIYNCSIEFANKIGVQNLSTERNKEEIEKLRHELEEYGSYVNRGDAWVSSLASFICSNFNDPDIISMKKEGKIDSIFQTSIYYHIKSWDENLNEKNRMDSIENQRFLSEIELEKERIENARARAMLYLSVCGIALVIFMFLSLYLLFAKIENNLSNINKTLLNTKEEI